MANTTEFAVERAKLQGLLQQTIDIIEASSQKATFKITVGSRKVATVEAGKVADIRFRDARELANVRSALSDTPRNDKQVSIVLGEEKIFAIDRKSNVTIDTYSLSNLPARVTPVEPIEAADVVEAAIAATEQTAVAEIVEEGVVRKEVSEGNTPARSLVVMAANSPEPEARVAESDVESAGAREELSDKDRTAPDLAPKSIVATSEAVEIDDLPQVAVRDLSPAEEAVPEGDIRAAAPPTDEQPENNRTNDPAAQEPAVVRDVSERSPESSLTSDRVAAVFQAIHTGIGKVSKQIADLQEAANAVESPTLSSWMQAIGQQAREAGKVVFTQAQQEAEKLAAVAKAQALEAAVVVADTAVARGRQVVRDTTDKATAIATEMGGAAVVLGQQVTYETTQKASAIASDAGKIAVELGSNAARSAASFAADRASKVASKAAGVVADKYGTVKEDAGLALQQGTQTLHSSVSKLWNSKRARASQARDRSIAQFDSSATGNLNLVKAARSLGDILGRAKATMTRIPVPNPQRGVDQQAIGTNITIDDSALHSEKNVYVVDLGAYLNSDEPLSYLGVGGEFSLDPASARIFESVDSARIDIPDNSEYAIIATDQRNIEARDLSSDSAQKVREVAQTVLMHEGTHQEGVLLSNIDGWEIAGEVIEGSPIVSVSADAGSSTLAIFHEGELVEGNLSLEDLQAFHSAHSMMQALGDLTSQEEFDKSIGSVRESLELAEVEV